jgi:ribosomal protein L30/L7E
MAETYVLLVYPDTRDANVMLGLTKTYGPFTVHETEAAREWVKVTHPHYRFRFMPLMRMADAPQAKED